MIEVKTREERLIEQVEEEINKLAEELEKLSDMDPMEYANETRLDEDWEIDFRTSEIMYSYGYLNYAGLVDYKQAIETMIDHYKGKQDEDN